MAYKSSYELHHHFPRLAEESGFTFNTHRPRVHIDWNKIKLIDIENLIRERKFVLIEQHLNDILDCVFESEFDVRILDEGVLKMFRLAQLAVEYQQFCRHYLDRSVYVLREEINSLAKDLDMTKKQLQDRDEELRKFRKRSRHSFKSTLPYGNDNIAAMILKTLSNKGETVFPSTSNADALQYNKCSYCEKVFLNQLYLQSHIARRHAEAMETPQKEKQATEQNNENAKLSAEIMELRTKLKDMEQAFTSANKTNNPAPPKEPEIKTVVNTENKKPMKDAEVSTNTEEYLLNKFEDWKKEEHEKYNKEITVLRTQILETINSIKENQTAKIETKDNKIVEQLQNTIREQGLEISGLKQELVNSKKEKTKEDTEKNKVNEDQIAFFTKRAEAQTKQYEALLQKLNEVAREAKESRALVNIEREKANHLQNLLQESRNRKVSETVQASADNVVVTKKPVVHHEHQQNNISREKKFVNKPKTADRETLENLHRKAQELLNIASLSSTTSESSDTIREEIKPFHKNGKGQTNIKGHSNTKVEKYNHEDTPTKVVNSKPPNKIEVSTPKQRNHIIIADKANSNKASKAKVAKVKNAKSKLNNGHAPTSNSGSPMRVVRAKLTEEVNSRLASFGVDPLKIRLPRNVFHKQRMELQQTHDVKTKKNPSYEKVRHSILAYLDSNISNTSATTKQMNGIHEYVSPNKTNKTFRSLTSVISNVKSKALSLVKLNDSVKEKRKTLDADVAKRAMSLLNTPPGSAPESPVRTRSPKKKDIDTKYDNVQNTNKSKAKTNHDDKTEKGKTKTYPNKKQILNAESEEESTESDHKYYNTAVISETTKSIENLIKSPARRPASADTNLNNTVRKYTIENGLFNRTQSASNLTQTKVEVNNVRQAEHLNNENSSDDIESLSDSPIKKTQSEENLSSIKQTKGVLKNASSMSSLNKKKVIFDMDAIQMKSVSASPSQSITEKSEVNEKYELGLVNLDGEEWDISSIDNEPLKNDTKIQINTRTSPKIAELKQSIESQLARRNDTPSTAIVGGVDILSGPLPRVPSIGGSNTSLGSSILDDSDAIPPVNTKAFVKPKRVTEKDDSELDISEFSIDGIANKNESF